MTDEDIVDDKEGAYMRWTGVVALLDDLMKLMACLMVSVMAPIPAPTKRKALIVSALFFGILFFLNISYAEIIPSSRRIQWDPGVRGGIPNRTTICSTLSPSGGNDAPAIQSAINNCPVGQVVKLNAGLINISATISLRSGITLRGSGMNSTIIRGSSGLTPLIYITASNASYGTARNLSGTPTKGDTTITTSTAHGWNVGDYILIDQLEEPSGNPVITNDGQGGACTWCGRESGNRPIGQWTKITGVPTATSAAIDPPLYWSYKTSFTAQGVKAQTVITDVGVEDLLIDNSISAAAEPIRLFFAVNSWFSRVRVDYAGKHMIKITGGLWNTFKDSTFNANAPLGGGTDQGYVFYIITSGTATLIENNIFHRATVPVAYEGANAGHVVAYNYIRDPQYGYSDWTGLGIAFHGAHPIMTLYESNYIEKGRIQADNYWGSASHNTFFRNRVFGNSAKSDGNWDFDLQKTTTYHNVVGNVAGIAGLEQVYQTTAPMSPYSYASIFNLGYNGHSGSGNDPNVLGTLYRHGNWDSIDNAAKWDPANSDHTLPPSLYLTSKPSFFGSCAWPAIGPDLNPMTGTLPAKARYESGGASECTPSTPPNPPKNLRIN